MPRLILIQINAGCCGSIATGPSLHPAVSPMARKRTDWRLHDVFASTSRPVRHDRGGLLEAGTVRFQEIWGDIVSSSRGVKRLQPARLMSVIEVNPDVTRTCQFVSVCPNSDLGDRQFNCFASSKKYYQL